MMVDHIPRDLSDIQITEEKVRKLMANYLTLLERLPSFKEEENWPKLKDLAREIRVQLLEIQKEMHAVVNSFVAMEEPELQDATFGPELAGDVRELKGAMYAKYVKQIEACCAQFRPVAS